MDTETVDLAIKLVGNLGFPIFVAVWLLMRSDRLLRELHDAIVELTNLIRKTPGG